MEWVETTGETEMVALQAAAERLGVMASEIEVELLTEAASSLFGLRKTSARIRARVRPTAPPPKIERHDRRGRSGGRRLPRASGKPAGDTKDRPERSAKSGSKKVHSADVGESGKTSSKPKPKPKPKAGQEPPRPEQSRTLAAEAPETKHRSRRLASAASLPSDRVPQRSAKAMSDLPGLSRRRTRRIDLPKKEDMKMSDETTIEEQSEIVATFLEGLVQSFGLEASTNITSTEDDYIDVRIDGSDLGVLIGPGGHTLASLGEVAKTALQRQLGGSSRSRVRVDIAGYRALRREALESFTADVASKVRETGANHAFEPMNATDRKIVHDAVGSLDGVGSESDGDEPRRRVVVVPG